MKILKTFLSITIFYSFPLYSMQPIHIENEPLYYDEPVSSTNNMTSNPDTNQTYSETVSSYPNEFPTSPEINNSNFTNFDDYVDQLRETYRDGVVIDTILESGERYVECYTNLESYHEIYGINNEPESPSYDHTTDSNYDGDRQAQQDFAQDSRQESDRYEHETQQKDKQSSWSDSISTPNTKAKSMSNTDSTQKNKPVSHETPTFNKPYVDPIKAFEKNLQSPEYRKTLADYRDKLEKSLNDKGADKQTIEKQIAIINTTLDNNSMLHILNTIKNGSLKDAKETFIILKNMHPWKPHTSYLVDKPTTKQEEFDDILGLNIMKVAESSLVGRVDYLTLNRVSPESLEHCIKNTLRPMQLQGDKKGLEQFRAQKAQQLRKNDTLQTKAEIVAVDSLLSDPLTQILDNIKNAPLNIAEKEFGSFKVQILHHIETQNFKNMDEVKADMMEREGADILDAANKCFESRPDYPAYQERVAQQQADAEKTSNTSPNANNNQAKTNNNQDTNNTNQDTNNTNNQDVPSNNKQDTTNTDNLDNGSETKNNATTDQESKQNKQSNQDPDQYTRYIIDDFSDEQSVEDLSSKKQKAKPESQAQKQTKPADKHKYPNPDILNARKKAVAIVENNPTVYRKQEYELDFRVYATLRSHRINADTFIYCGGNAIQQQIHAECVRILNETIHIPSDVSTQPLLDLVVTCTYAGHTYSQQNNTDKAFSLVNCAWAALDCAKVICDNGINIATTGTTDIAKGLIKGCINAIKNNVNIVLDPVGTATNIAESFVHLGYCFGKLMEPIMYFDGDLAYNEIDWDVADAIQEEWVENVQGVINAASQVTLEGGAAFVAETLLSPKITKMGVNFISRYAKPTANQMAKLGKALKDKAGDKAKNVIDAVRPRPVVTTPEGIRMTIPHAVEDANELYSAMGKQHGNSHSKRPTFNDIKNEVSNNAKTKGSDLSNKIIKSGSNGTYKGAKYHHKNSSGLKSAAPKDGQKALDNSVRYSDRSPHRVSTSEGEIVILSQTSPSEFHGHVRTWEQLLYEAEASEEIRNTLINNGFVNMKGKVLK